MRAIQPDSPVARLGTIRSGDEIWSINDKRTAGVTVEKTQALLDGELSGSRITMKLLRRRRTTADDEPPICDRFVLSLSMIVAALCMGMLVMSGLLSDVLPASFPEEHRAQQQQYHQQQQDARYQPRQQPAGSGSGTAARQAHQHGHGNVENRGTDNVNHLPNQDYDRAHHRGSNHLYDASADDSSSGSRSGSSSGSGFGFGASNHDEVVRPQDMRDLYTTLGVARGATDADIKKAYRKLSRMLHPDKGGDPAEFQALNRAYEVLSNGDLRFLYDLHPFEPGRGMDLVKQFLGFEDVRAHQIQVMANLGSLPGGGGAGFFDNHHRQHHQQHHQQHQQIGRAHV